MTEPRSPSKPHKFRIVAPATPAYWQVGFVCLDPRGERWTIVAVDNLSDVVWALPIPDSQLVYEHISHWYIEPDEDEIAL